MCCGVGWRPCLPGGDHVAADDVQPGVLPFDVLHHLHLERGVSLRRVQHNNVHVAHIPARRGGAGRGAHVAERAQQAGRAARTCSPRCWLPSTPPQRSHAMPGSPNERLKAPRSSQQHGKPPRQNSRGMAAMRCASQSGQQPPTSAPPLAPYPPPGCPPQLPPAAGRQGPQRLGLRGVRGPDWRRHLSAWPHSLQHGGPQRIPGRQQRRTQATAALCFGVCPTATALATRSRQESWSKHRWLRGDGRRSPGSRPCRPLLHALHWRQHRRAGRGGGTTRGAERDGAGAPPSGMLACSLNKARVASATSSPAELTMGSLPRLLARSSCSAFSAVMVSAGRRDDARRST